MSSGRSPLSWPVLAAELPRLLEAVPGWMREDTAKAARRLAALIGRDVLATIDAAATRDAAAEALDIARRTLFRTILPRLRPGAGDDP